MRLRVAVELGGAARGSALIAVPDSLTLVSDLFHHLHKQFGLPQVFMNLAVHGFVLLPASRVVDVLRDGDIVEVRLTPSAPSLAKRRRVESPLAALQDGNLGSPQVASKITPWAGPHQVQSDLSASGGAARNNGKGRVPMQALLAVPASNMQTCSKGTALLNTLPAQSAPNAQSRGKGIATMQALPAPSASTARDRGKGRAPMQALPAPPASDMQSRGLDSAVLRAPSTPLASDVQDGRARPQALPAPLASHVPAPFYSVARLTPSESLPDASDANLWKPIGREPEEGEVIRFRVADNVAGRRGLSDFRAAECIGVSVDTSVPLCTLRLRNAAGREESRSSTELLQVAVRRVPRPTLSDGAGARRTHATSSVVAAAPVGIASASADSETASALGMVAAASIAAEPPVPAATVHVAAAAPPLRNAVLKAVPESSSDSEEVAPPRARADRKQTAAAAGPDRWATAARSARPPSRAELDAVASVSSYEELMQAQLQKVGEDGQLAWQKMVELRGSVKQQVQHYFADRTYSKDRWLLSQVDPEGWLSLPLVAGFNRIRDLVGDLTLDFRLEFVRSCLESSELVEVSPCGWWLRKSQQLMEPPA